MLSKSKPHEGLYSFARWISCSRRVYNSKFTPQENRYAYDLEYSEEGLGANLQFFFYCQTSIQQKNQQNEESWKALESKMTKCKLIASQFLEQWDHHFLNESSDAVSGKGERIPSFATIEMLAQIAYRKLKVALPELICVSIREANRWVGECDNADSAKYRRVFSLSCAHQHRNPLLSESENQILFGKCAAIHGHEYSLEVEVSGPIDPQTGLVISRGEFKSWVEREVVIPFHGELLNAIMGNASGELILENIASRLTASEHNLRIALRETRKNSFYWGLPFHQPVQSSKL